MPRDASGAYTLPTNDSSPAAPRNVIRSSDFNELTSDYATALTDSLSRSGDGAMLADLDMDGFSLLNEPTTMKKAQNLADLADKGTAQDNIQLGVEFVDVAAAELVTIPARNKRLRLQFRVSANKNGGGDYRRISFADLTGYPSASFFRSVDRFMPDGSTDNANGGYWVLDEAHPEATMLGAKADGVTNDNAAIVAGVQLAPFNLTLPPGEYATGLTDPLAYPGSKMTGEGQLILNGFKQAPKRRIIVDAVVKSSDNEDRFKVFDGDWVKNCFDPIYTFIGSGATGTPAVTYTNFVELATRFEVYENDSGFNVSPNTHTGGRSGVFRDALRLYQKGQGDLVGGHTYGSISSNRPGATHWFANPAVIVENGNLGIESINGFGGYLNHSEYIYSDNGFGAAAIDRVRNYDRQSDDTSLEQVWGHDYANSSGSKPVDWAYSIRGKFKTGYNTVAADLGTDNAAFAMKRNHRIYGDAESIPDSEGSQFCANLLGTTYYYFNGTAWVFVVNGSPTLQSGENDVTIDGDLFVSGSSPWIADTAVPTANGAFTSVTCNRRYKKLGRTVQINVKIVITTNGAAADFISVPLPFEAANTDILAGAVTAGNFFPVVARTVGASLVILNTTGGYPGGTGYTLNISGAYEATT